MYSNSRCCCFSKRTGVLVTGVTSSAVSLGVVLPIVYLLVREGGWQFVRGEVEKWLDEGFIKDSQVRRLSL